MITKVRAGRVAAVFLGLQDAKGTPVSDFTSSQAARVWSNDGRLDPSPVKSDPTGWMTAGQVEAGARYNVEGPNNARLIMKATPAALELLLASNWGELDEGEFTLEAQVGQWLTAALVESVLEDSPQYLYRLHDGLIHRLAIRAEALEPLLLEADYAAESDSEPVALDDLGGITLPAPPMPVTDKNVFPGRLSRLVRDPAGAAEEITFASVEISIDQRLGQEWDQTHGVFEVFKAGFPGPLVRIRAAGHVSAETWAILSNSRAGTKQSFRFTAEAQSPAKTLQIDLHGVDFVVEPHGHVGQKFVPFIGVGQAHLEDDDTFVTITLT